MADEPTVETAQTVEARVQEDLIVQLGSLALRVAALEDAICNLQGFTRQEADGSHQGRVTFSRVPEGQLPAVPKDVTV